MLQMRSAASSMTIMRSGEVLELCDLRLEKKKNDNFTYGNRRAQDRGDIRPSRGAVDTAQCPHAPVTLHSNTCGGRRDALAGHYLCCDGGDKCKYALLHRVGGFITSAELEARPCAGAPPPSAMPVPGRQACLGGGESAEGPPPPHPLSGGDVLAFSGGGGLGLAPFWRPVVGLERVRLPRRTLARGETVLLA